ncbi:hypothetical protein HK096_008986 [Nowakowskiella sp. JEL0078]|nr:hypothetical protein HK096_008986 [Nowakowskiella sp. JEL0078]
MQIPFNPLANIESWTSPENLYSPLSTKFVHPREPLVFGESDRSEFFNLMSIPLKLASPSHISNIKLLDITVSNMSFITRRRKQLHLDSSCTSGNDPESWPVLQAAKKKSKSTRRKFTQRLLIEDKTERLKWLDVSIGDNLMRSKAKSEFEVAKRVLMEQRLAEEEKRLLEEQTEQKRLLFELAIEKKRLLTEECRLKEKLRLEEEKKLEEEQKLVEEHRLELGKKLEQERSSELEKKLHAEESKLEEARIIGAKHSENNESKQSSNDSKIIHKGKATVASEVNEDKELVDKQKTKEYIREMERKRDANLKLLAEKTVRVQKRGEANKPTSSRKILTIRSVTPVDSSAKETDSDDFSEVKEINEPDQFDTSRRRSSSNGSTTKTAPQTSKKTYEKENEKISAHLKSPISFVQSSTWSLADSPRLQKKKKNHSIIPEKFQELTKKAAAKAKFKEVKDESKEEEPKVSDIVTKVDSIVAEYPKIDGKTVQQPKVQQFKTAQVKPPKLIEESKTGMKEKNVLTKGKDPKQQSKTIATTETSYLMNKTVTTEPSNTTKKTINSDITNLTKKTVKSPLQTVAFKVTATDNKTSHLQKMPSSKNAKPVSKSANQTTRLISNSKGIHIEKKDIALIAEKMGSVEIDAATISFALSSLSSTDNMLSLRHPGKLLKSSPSQYTTLSGPMQLKNGAVEALSEQLKTKTVDIGINSGLKNLVQIISALGKFAVSMSTAADAIVLEDPRQSIQIGETLDYLLTTIALLVKALEYSERTHVYEGWKQQQEILRISDDEDSEIFADNEDENFGDIDSINEDGYLADDDRNRGDTSTAGKFDFVLQQKDYSNEDIMPEFTENLGIMDESNPIVSTFDAKNFSTLLTKSTSSSSAARVSNRPIKVKKLKMKLAGQRKSQATSKLTNRSQAISTHMMNAITSSITAASKALESLAPGPHSKILQKQFEARNMTAVAIAAMSEIIGLSLNVSQSFDGISNVEQPKVKEAVEDMKEMLSSVKGCIEQIMIRVKISLFKSGTALDPEVAASQNVTQCMQILSESMQKNANKLNSVLSDICKLKEGGSDEEKFHDEGDAEIERGVLYEKLTAFDKEYNLQIQRSMRISESVQKTPTLSSILIQSNDFDILSTKFANENEFQDERYKSDENIISGDFGSKLTPAEMTSILNDAASAVLQYGVESDEHIISQIMENNTLNFPGLVPLVDDKDANSKVQESIHDKEARAFIAEVGMAAEDVAKSLSSGDVLGKIFSHSHAISYFLEELERTNKEIVERDEFLSKIIARNMGWRQHMAGLIDEPYMNLDKYQVAGPDSAQFEKYALHPDDFGEFEVDSEVDENYDEVCATDEDNDFEDSEEDFELVDDEKDSETDGESAFVL